MWMDKSIIYILYNDWASVQFSHPLVSLFCIFPMIITLIKPWDGWEWINGWMNKWVQRNCIEEDKWRSWGINKSLKLPKGTETVCRKLLLQTKLSIICQFKFKHQFFLSFEIHCTEMEVWLNFMEYYRKFLEADERENKKV